MRSEILHIFNFRELNQNLVHTGLCKLHPIKFMSALSLASMHVIHSQTFDLRQIER